MSDYRVQFRAPRAPLGRRWRSCRAPSATEAVIEALRGVRPGALARFARGRRPLVGYVHAPHMPKHSNGMPFCIFGFELKVGADA